MHLNYVYEIIDWRSTAAGRKTTVADADAHVDADADADAGFDRAGILDGDIGHAVEAALHLL